MRIIKKNDPEAIVTCDHCKSEIAYHNSDIHWWSFAPDYIICPVCGFEIFVNLIKPQTNE